MKVKKESSFVTVDDVKHHDLIEILSEGEEVEGEWGLRLVVKVKTSDGTEKKMSLNSTSKNNLIDLHGEETEEWVGKQLLVHVIKQKVGKDMKNVIYLTGLDDKEGKTLGL